MVVLSSFKLSAQKFFTIEDYDSVESVETIGEELRNLTNPETNDHFESVFGELCRQDDLDSEKSKNLISKLREMLKKDRNGEFEHLGSFQSLIMQLTPAIRIQRGL